MGYGGYLVKFGDYTIPNGLIKQDTYSAYRNMQDYEPWSDEDGYEHRDAVKLKAIKVEFETKAMLTEKEFNEFWSNIRKNYVKADERGGYITAYIPEIGGYETQYGYIADIQPVMYTVAGGIKYDSVKFSFIGGVYHGK
jgi:hypothetical protein|uniref:Uncharacterized protein n=1 Tax=virus sp. ctQ5V6 TaxID=2825815 RepID=A0A8S5RQG0_9VIRU|nr:MAG TPA: hypothetical protein [virus sp. ctQ5V6]DAQ14106.1 MAG TPA: hypothetical protein [Bacteriophage sp.]